MLFWNHGIVFLQEGFLEVMISAGVNYNYMMKQEDAWANSNIVFNNIVTIFLTIATGLLIMFIAFYLWPRISDLKKKIYKKRFGSAYDMINTKKSKYAMLDPLFFFARRTLLVIAVVAMVDYPTFQIMFFIFPTMVQMVNLGEVEPLSTRKANRMELYNSWSILNIMYCLLCLTMFVPDANARYQVGFAMIALTG